MVYNPAWEGTDAETTAQNTILDPNYNGAAVGYGNETDPSVKVSPYGPNDPRPQWMIDAGIFTSVGPWSRYEVSGGQEGKNSLSDRYNPTTQTVKLQSGEGQQLGSGALSSTAGTAATAPTTAGTISGYTGAAPAGADPEAWQAFADYAVSLGLDPSTLANSTGGALPYDFYSSLLPEGTTQADMIRADFIMDPSYQFRFGEGQRATERRQNAMGNRFSGGGLAELTRYGQDYASQEYGNAYNRMAGITGMGQTANQTLSGAGQQFGTNLGNIYQGLGQAQGNAILAGGNAQAGAASAAAGPAISGWNQLGSMWNNISWS